MTTRVAAPPARPRRALRAPLALLSVLAGLLGEARPAAAGGFTITSMGGRRSGSLVNLGKPDDLTAVFHNPAGLADQGGVRLHLSNSFTLIQSDFRMRALDERMYPEINPDGCGSQPGGCPWPIDPQGYYRQSMRPERYFGTVPFLALSTDWRFAGRGGRRVVSALAIYLPVFYGATLRRDAPTAYQLVEGFFAVGAASFATGWRINRYVAVGGTISYYYHRLAMNRRFSVVRMLTPTGEEDNPPGEATLGQDLIGDLFLDYTGEDHGVGWNAAVLISPTPWLSIGLNYNGATKARFVGGMSITARDQNVLNDALHLLGYKLPRQLEVEMPIPHSVQVGVNLAPAWWVEVGVDFRCWLYQVYKRQTVTPIYDPSEDGVEVIDTEALSQDKQYRLSYEIALGALLRPLRRHRGLELLVGVSFDRSPIPDRTFSLDNVSLDSVNVAGGVRWAINHHWRLALTYAVYVYVPRHIRDSIVSPPSNGDASGVFHMPSIEAQYTF